MLIIDTRHFFFLKKKEIWFYNEEPHDEAAYTVYSYVRQHLTFKKRFDAQSAEQTLTIDLHRSEADIFKQISRTFRYHIHKATRHGIVFENLASPRIEECKDLIASFNAFADQKKIRRAGKKRVFALRQTGNLFITRAKKDDHALVTHVYLGDGSRAVLLYSFHSNLPVAASERGYANKFLHWQDILFFKKQNYATYDLGGINSETVPGITHFKLGFGGKEETIQNYIRVASWIRPVFSMYKKMFG